MGFEHHFLIACALRSSYSCKKRASVLVPNNPMNPGLAVALPGTREDENGFAREENGE
jgi:hypothetical protein